MKESGVILPSFDTPSLRRRFTTYLNFIYGKEEEVTFCELGFVHSIEEKQRKNSTNEHSGIGKH